MPRFLGSTLAVLFIMLATTGVTLAHPSAAPPAAPPALITAAFTEFTLTSGGTTQGITTGPDGNLWFAERGGAGDAIGRITPQGVITTYPLDFSSGWPDKIVAGADGNLWF